MRAGQFGACGIAAVVGGGAAVAQVSVLQRSVVTIPAMTVDQNGVGFTIAGMSGVTHRLGTAGASEFVAVMDNSNKLVRVGVAFNADGTIASHTVLGGVTLAQTGDHEGIALAGGAGGAAGSVLVSNETGPGIAEFALATGAFVRSLPVPGVFTAAGNLRANFGFESLCRRGTTGEVWTANEEALTVDGALSTPTEGTRVRLVRYAGAELAAQQQLVYVTDPIHGSVISGSRSGVSDLVALPDGRLLVLERSLALGAGIFRTAIYLVDPGQAGVTDVSGMAGLIGQAYVPVDKVRVFEGFLNQNLEGLSLGPRLSPTTRALLGVVDDADFLSNNTLVSFLFSDAAMCAADTDASRSVTIDDLFRYLNMWFTGDPEADIDGVGGVAIDDLFKYLNSYFVGC